MTGGAAAAAAAADNIVFLLCFLFLLSQFPSLLLWFWCVFLIEHRLPERLHYHATESLNTDVPMKLIFFSPLDVENTEWMAFRWKRRSCFLSAATVTRDEVLMVTWRPPVVSVCFWLLPQILWMKLLFEVVICPWTTDTQLNVATSIINHKTTGVEFDSTAGIAGWWVKMRWNRFSSTQKKAPTLLSNLR